MRLQDPACTHVVLVTLAKITPVSKAAALQQDLRRAGIEFNSWVVNKCLTGSGTRDPLLVRRQQREAMQIERVRSGLAARTFVLPWQATAPVGICALAALLRQRTGSRLPGLASTRSRPGNHGKRPTAPLIHRSSIYIPYL